MIRPLTPAESSAVPPRLRRAAQEFEAQALARLLQPAFGTIGSEGLFGGGTAEAQWRPMLVDAMAGAAASAGRALGIADAVLREMLRRQSASTATTDAEDAPR